MEEDKSNAVADSSPLLCHQTVVSNACDQPDASVEDDMDKKLDISSEKFDPLLALYSPKVPLPYPNIRCFNNIAEYESFMRGGRGRAKPENVEKRLRKARKGVKDPERIERLKKLMVNNPVEGEEGGAKRALGKQKARKNVLTRMPMHEGSPLGVLNRCVQGRIRVKVHIRTFKGLRGVCAGFVVAFDKFWNLAMVDVDETYREPLLGEAFYHEKALTVTRLFQKLQMLENQEISAVEKDSGKAAAKISEPDELGSEVHHQTTSSIRTVQDPKQAPEGPGTSRRSDTSSARRQKVPKPKVEYGRVCTRHVNQLFIRGENVLLVNIQQEL
ncbi:U7 snRNA-associated Sm-like protein LSm11 [Electrophorus electricus]|uniref:LSM domain-containing protein n=1 Tax=Electrophorus electricus TaxID=8005 RepID=A0A4W4GDC8_ELEEL|nr:U7 snRNA-associated Sm-like protein LSm11 [Electrophorus electricus]